MKKMIVAVLAVMMTLTLTGCGDETEKAMKKFVPAEITDLKEIPYTIGDAHYCNATDFMKKTKGDLGKSKYRKN